LRNGSPIGEHRVTFRPDGDRLTVETRVEIAVKVLFFTAFRFKRQAEEVWWSGRLVSVTSTTDDNGTPRVGAPPGELRSHPDFCVDGPRPPGYCRPALRPALEVRQ